MHPSAQTERRFRRLYKLSHLTMMQKHIRIGPASSTCQRTLLIVYNSLFSHNVDMASSIQRQRIQIVFLENGYG